MPGLVSAGSRSGANQATARISPWSAAAQGAQASIAQELRTAGFPPYRLDINTRAAPESGEITRRLKAAFDPLGLVAPGHYES